MKRYRTVVRGAGIPPLRRMEAAGTIHSLEVESLGLDVETGQEWFQVSWIQVK